MASEYFEEEWRSAAPSGTVTPPPPDPNPPPTNEIILVSSSLRAFDSEADRQAYLGNSNLKAWDDKSKGTDSAPGYLYMTEAQRRAVDNGIADTLLWDPTTMISPQYYTTVTRTEPDGVTRTAKIVNGQPPAGQYPICRDLANKGLGLVNLVFRASRNLTALSLASMDVRHARALMRDNSGVGSLSPDGYDGWSYGTDGQNRITFAYSTANTTSNDFADSKGRRFKPHPDSTAILSTNSAGQTWIRYAHQDAGNVYADGVTGRETELEDSVVAPQMVVGLAAWQNRDKYCPINEPIGSRPPTPAYYLNTALDSTHIYEQFKGKYAAYWAGKGKSQAFLDLPLNMKKDILHAVLDDMVAGVAYAKIKGGAEWRTHPEYLQCIRAWNMVLGPMQAVGAVHPNGTTPANGKQQYYTRVRNGKTCVVFAHRVHRFNPSSTTKDSTGEYVTLNTASDSHNTTYTRMTFNALTFFKMEGCTEFEGLDNMLEWTANTTAEALINHGKNINGLPEYMCGNGVLSAPTGWATRSGTASKTNWGGVAKQAYFGLAAYDASNIVVTKNNEIYDSNSGRAGFGALGAAMFNYATKEGKLVPHTEG